MRSFFTQTPLPRHFLSRLPTRRNLQHQLRANSSSQPKSQGIANAAKSTEGTASSTSNATAGPQAVGQKAAPVSIWMRLGPLTTIASAYGRAQKKRPYVVQTLSAMVIFTCADISAQSIGGDEYQPVRTARSVLIGSLFAIPQYRWFFVLARYFNYKSRVLSITAKVVFNQFTFAVAFPTYFFGMQALLSGEGIAGTIERLKDTVPRSWQNSWKVWPAAMAVNLSFVPLEYRAIFSGIVAIGWQTYLSWMNRQAEMKEHGEDKITQEKPVSVIANEAAVAA